MAREQTGLGAEETEGQARNEVAKKSRGKVIFLGL
jgi:hypothetical protein